MKKKYWGIGKQTLLVWFLLLGFNHSLMAKKIAFLVGVGNVEPTLRTALDIRTIKSLLAKDYDEVIELQDSKATYLNVRNVFKKLYKLKEEDTLFFYYTGHGSRFYHGDGERDNLDEFLVLSSMDVRGNAIYGGVMIDDELNYHFSKIKAKKILFFDCCHSETMKKGGGVLKSWHPKGGSILYRRFNVDARYNRAVNSNYINLSASGDEEQSEDSYNGGIFTLTLKQVLEEKGDIPFSELITGIKKSLFSVARKNGQSGDFIPNMESNRMNPKRFRTKDIFVVPTAYVPKARKESLEVFLQSRLGGIVFKKQEKKSKFSLYDSVYLKSKHSSNYNHLYMIEVKKNQYSLITRKKLSECSSGSCVFRNLVASEPVGKSNIYLIASKYPLSIAKKTFSETLKSQLEHQKFEVGMVSFETIE